MKTKRPPIPCPVCQQVFTPKREWQKYCSGVCRWQAWDKANPRVKATEQPT